MRVTWHTGPLGGLGVRSPSRLVRRELATSRVDVLWSNHPPDRLVHSTVQPLQFLSPVDSPTTAFSVVNKPIIMSKHVVFRRDTLAAPQISSVVAASRSIHPTPRSLIDRNTQAPQFRRRPAGGLSATHGDEDAHVRVGSGTPRLRRALRSLSWVQENTHPPSLLPSGEPSKSLSLRVLSGMARNCGPLLLDNWQVRSTHRGETASEIRGRTSSCVRVTGWRAEPENKSPLLAPMKRCFLHIKCCRFGRRLRL